MRFIQYFAGICTVSILTTACVSTKKFDSQTAELRETSKNLNTAVIEQELLKTKVNLLQDSLRQLKKQVTDDRVVSEFAVYKTALAMGDRNLAAGSLVRLLQLDSSQGSWAYDSLVYYHYLYLITPGFPRQSMAAAYYTEKGLALNPKNAFLLETKAKLLLEAQQDSAAFKIFRSLWETHGDYTYLWEMTYMDLYIFENIKKVESTIAEVTGNKLSQMRMVRVESLEEHRIDEIPAKAAFLYLRAILQSAKGQTAAAKKTLEEVVKIAPGFLSAQRALFQIKNPQYRQ